MSDHSSSADNSRLGRPRSEEATEAIREAALDILLRDGYRAVTIEGVAAEAGVGKQTIYRRWSGKAELVLDTVAAQAEVDVPVPDTGALESDLEAFLQATFEEARTKYARALRGLAAEALLDPEFASLYWETFVKKRRGSFAELVERGQERGELREDADLTLIMDMIYGTLFYRLMNRHAPLDDDLAATLADQVVSTFE